VVDENFHWEALQNAMRIFVAHGWLVPILFEMSVHSTLKKGHVADRRARWRN
jgi:hypothetical protein